MDNFETDRKSLRCVITPGENWPRTVAAFYIGRLLNELRFLYTCAWIGSGTEDMNDRRDIIIADMCTLLPRVAKNERDQEIVSAFRSTTRSFNQHLKSVDFAESWEAEDIEFERNWSDPDGEDLFAFANKYVENITREFKSWSIQLLENMCENDGVAFELGFHIDQVIHPIWSEFTCSFVKGLRDVDLRFLMGGAQGVNDEQFNFLRAPRQINSPWVDKQWRRTLCHLEARLRRLLCSKTSSRLSDSANEKSIRSDFLLDSISDFVCNVENGELVSQLLTSAANRKLSFYGFNFRIDKYEIEYHDILRRLKPQMSKLLTVFLNAETVSLLELGNNWLKLGIGSKKVDSGVARSAVNKLVSELDNFPISITSEGFSVYALGPAVVESAVLM